MPKPVIGHQIIGPDGRNIHGEENDPFDLCSFEILTGEAVEQAKNWVAANSGFKVVPVFEGDVEEPEFVSTLTVSAHVSNHVSNHGS
jgi:hypothetical protein